MNVITFSAINGFVCIVLNISNNFISHFSSDFKTKRFFVFSKVIRAILRIWSFVHMFVPKEGLAFTASVHQKSHARTVATYCVSPLRYNIYFQNLQYTIALSTFPRDWDTVRVKASQAGALIHKTHHRARRAHFARTLIGPRLQKITIRRQTVGVPCVSLRPNGLYILRYVYDVGNCVVYMLIYIRCEQIV